MRTTREVEGRWWIFGPDKPSHYGVLRFDPESGLTLNVKIPNVQSFSEVMGAPWAVNAADVISGRDSDNKIITLFACNSPSNTRSGGMLAFEFRPIAAVIGSNYTQWSDVSFDNVTVRYSLLHQWIERSSISVDFDKDTAGFKRKDDIVFNLSSDVKLSLGASVNAHHSGSGLDISEGHWAEFSLPSATTFDRLFEDYVLVFRRFLTLLTGEGVFVDSIKFDNGKVEFLQQNPGVGDAERKTHAQNMIASYSELGDDANTIINHWFDYHERLQPALNLYFAVIFNGSLYSNHRFLFLAQALEVYHRINPNFPNAVEPTAEFRRRIARVTSSAPPEERAWVKEKLQHANEKTLAQRIEDILSTAPTQIDKFIRDRAEFAAKVRHTRNYYIHFMAELRDNGRAADDQELLPLTEQMRGLLLLCILRDLGISGKPLERVAHGVYSLRFTSL